MSSTTILKINNISKSYNSINGETKVIDNIFLEVNKGDFVSLIGSSGCGKSTILNIISGIDKEYNGKIEFNNNIKIGYMLQDDSLFDWLTVYENALLGLKIKKELNEASKEYVKELLIRYGLIEFIDKYPSSLSGGMRQRVG